MRNISRGVAFAFLRQLVVAGGSGQMRLDQPDGLGLLRVLRDGALLPTLPRGEDTGGDRAGERLAAGAPLRPAAARGGCVSLWGP